MGVQRGKEGGVVSMCLLFSPYFQGLGMSQAECEALTEWKKNESECLKEIQQHMNETAGTLEEEVFGSLERHWISQGWEISCLGTSILALEAHPKPCPSPLLLHTLLKCPLFG